MSNNIRIKRQYSKLAHDLDTIELRNGVWNPVSFTLTDQSSSGKFYDLITSLDGSKSPAEISRELGLSREEVDSVIDHLDEIGVLESGATNAFDYYLDNMAPTLVGTEETTQKSVYIIGQNETSEKISELLTNSFDDCKVSIASEQDPVIKILNSDDLSWINDGADFYERMESLRYLKDNFVLNASTYINPIQNKILNRASIANNFTWMHISIDGPMLLIGPIFSPKKSSCYECLEKRVLMNLRQDASYVAYKEALIKNRIKYGDPPITPIVSSILASHAALEVANYSKTGYSFTLGKMLTIFLPTMEFSYNDVLRVPGCSACGSLSERDDTELYFDMKVLLK